MGTLATFFRRNEFLPVAVEPAAKGQIQHITAARLAKPDARAKYQLRALPNDDVYFYCKRIDNSRIVRQSDPEAKGQCWSAIGAACVVAVLFGTVMAPKAATLLAGYKVQQLKQEQRALVEERKTLNVEEARVLSPGNLDELAVKRQLSSPGAGQIVHLQPKGEGAFASVLTPASMKSR
jgi:hypothetical protein